MYLDKDAAHKCLIQLGVEKKSTMDILHKEIPLPNGTHIYVLHMDGMGRMPREALAILTDIKSESVVANIINIKGDIIYKLIYKKNLNVIVYDLSLNQIIIESLYWNDLSKDELLNTFFTMICSQMENMNIIKNNNTPPDWWRIESDNSSQKLIEDNKRKHRNKDFITKLIVATMEELNITNQDITEISTHKNSESLHKKYSHLIDELIKFE